MSDETPTGRTIVVNKKFEESLSPEQLQAYLDAVVATSQNGAQDVDQVADELTQRFEQAGIGVAPIEAKHLAEHLVGDSTAELVFQTDDGRVLYSQGGSADKPGQHDARDPEDSDRPTMM